MTKKFIVGPRIQRIYQEKIIQSYRLQLWSVCEENFMPCENQIYHSKTQQISKDKRYITPPLHCNKNENTKVWRLFPTKIYTISFPFTRATEFGFVFWIMPLLWMPISPTCLFLYLLFIWMFLLLPHILCLRFRIKKKIKKNNKDDFYGWLYIPVWSLWNWLLSYYESDCLSNS